ncbi:reverse transcriptase [Cucumis melo var. makuwa]|uniref:Reverse transcriptase n=1 Tax=Cucumis melo var. makuwa TaxID=1194695 RepID=A0A5D3DIG6_CUCMM|nr:reverse transcriptase [Cucumis melo var. makuwa]TYK23383.1 reverse transcriptase [Cucumis melo var. makuwa]
MRKTTEKMETEEAGELKGTSEICLIKDMTDDDSQEEYEALQNEQEYDSSSGDEQGNIWNDNRDFRMRQAYREQEARREVHRDYKMKIDLLVYNGKRDIESFLDWIKSTENFFNYMDTPDRKKVHLVALKLRGVSA